MPNVAPTGDGDKTADKPTIDDLLTAPIPDAPAKPKKKPAKKTAPAAKPTAADDTSDGDGHTAASWARELLRRLGAPVTRANVRAIVSWEAAEGGHWHNTASYNPLNTTQDAAGASSMNSVGVKAYSSWDQGLDATVQTLRNGYYGPILAALQDGNHPGRVLNAVVASPWSTYGNGIQLVGSPKSYGTGGGSHVPASSYKKTAARKYGYLSAYLDDPEIGPILQKAAKQGWSQSRLMSALENTHWWKTHSDTNRKWQALQQTDPATYRQDWKQQRAKVGALAVSLGVKPGDARLDAITTTSMWSGWSDLQLNKALAAEFHYDPTGSYLGAAGTDVQKFKALSNQYLVPLSDHVIQKWTRRALAGEIQPEDYQGYLAQQAKTLFPWMAKAIDNGTSPDEFLNPYRQAASQTLEVNPADVDFSKGKWRNLFETVDPKTGERSERGLANAMSLMRTDARYGYDTTQQANKDAADFAQSLAQEFGFVG